MVALKGNEPTQVNTTPMEHRGDREIVITRTFNGPARIVFDAWTKPELVRRWWAPRSLGVTLASCDADVTVGGKYRYVLKGRKGDELGFSGKYLELDRPTRLVYTQVFEPMADAGEAIITITFAEHRGKTDVVSSETYPSAEVRDAAVSSGMEHGMREAMDQLDELVASLS
jgi:uncharacterized protein YndB with AHSA1/START domain